MNIQTKFDFKDQVYAIVLKKIRDRAECHVCKSKGKLKFEGVDAVGDCPKCHGYGMVTDTHSTYRVEPLTICKVYVETFNRVIDVFYTCDETGGLLGRKWKEIELYADKSDAVSKCSEMSIRKDGE